MVFLKKKRFLTHVSALAMMQAVALFSFSGSSDAGFEFVAPKKMAEKPAMEAPMMDEASPMMMMPDEMEPMHLNAAPAAPHAVTDDMGAMEGDVMMDKPKMHGHAEPVMHEDHPMAHDAAKEDHTMTKGLYNERPTSLVIDKNAADMEEHPEPRWMKKSDDSHEAKRMEEQMSPMMEEAHSSDMASEKADSEMVAMETMMDMPKSDMPHAIGFGNNLPLIAAMRQIVPEGYGLAPHKDVPMDAMTSWEGGQPWDTVLNGVLEAHGFVSHIDKNIVHILPKGVRTISPSAMETPQKADAKPIPVMSVVGDQSEASEELMKERVPVRLQQTAEEAPLEIAEMDAQAQDTELEKMMGESVSAVPSQEVVPAEKTVTTPVQEIVAEAEDTIMPEFQPEFEEVGIQKESDPHSMTMAMEGRDTAIGQDPLTLQPEAMRASVVPSTQTVSSNMAPSPEWFAAQSPAAGGTSYNDVSRWDAPKSSTLREILESWSNRANVELFWASEYDYPISTDVMIEGDFEHAVQTILKGLEESNPRPLGRLHPNEPNGPAVLVIETRRLTR